mmetsp:Transcript_90589/g.157238  ORF Transcript_90589/g.157238 Transcript_90589/m.157238 type:complete len:210 (+) Transcript_90589:884-1513(+)
MRWRTGFPWDPRPTMVKLLSGIGGKAGVSSGQMPPRCCRRASQQSLRSSSRQLKQGAGRSQRRRCFTSAVQTCSKEPRSNRVCRSHFSFTSMIREQVPPRCLQLDLPYLVGKMRSRNSSTSCRSGAVTRHRILRLASRGMNDAAHNFSHKMRCALRQECKAWLHLGEGLFWVLCSGLKRQLCFTLQCFDVGLPTQLSQIRTQMSLTLEP